MDNWNQQPRRFEFPLAKAEYLFSSAGQLGKGGDKQRFWRDMMGYPSPQSIRLAILSAVRIDQLVYQSENEYGRLYRAYIELQGNSGLVRRVRTVWIIPFEEDVVRFVTAFPDRLGGLP